MGTRKTTRQTRTKLTASMADLRSVVRLNPNNFDSFSFSFVLDKALQLEETPIANPIVHSLSSPLFSYTFEVFHYNLVSIEIGNNVFTRCRAKVRQSDAPEPRKITETSIPPNLERLGILEVFI